MIKVYYRSNCGSSKRTLNWFEKYNISIEKKQISDINKADLLRLLQFTDRGLKDVMKHSGKSSIEVKQVIDYIETLSFNEAIDYLLSYSKVLHTPIIMDEKNYLIGYNSDEIRKFLPKGYRQIQLNSKSI